MSPLACKLARSLQKVAVDCYSFCLLYHTETAACMHVHMISMHLSLILLTDIMFTRTYVLTRLMLAAS